MDAHNNNNVECYNKMEELQEKLRKSEEERMLLQRQFDLLLQDKERARVSSVEARYRKLLDEDKRRRDRNSSLLQAMDRIDSRTASLAAKTERMRMLRKHYETFIAHAYPSWHLQMERSYCPLAPLSSSPRLLSSEYLGCMPDSLQAQGLSDYTETRYLDLPAQTKCPLTTPRSRSEVSVVSRDECPVSRRPYFRKGSSIRSKSLSPTRVRDTSDRYEEDKITIPRNFSSYSLAQIYDTHLSPRVRDESFMQRDYGSNQSPRFKSNLLGIQNTGFSQSQKTPYNGHYSLDYERGNSDIEADQNTSGDLLNLSNLSLSDDGGLLDADLSVSPQSDAPHKTYNSPRSLLDVKRSKYSSLPSSQVSPRSNYTPRGSYMSRVSERYSPTTFLNYVPHPTLSPRNRKTDHFPNSVAVSDSVHRILLSPQDVEMTRLDFPASPRGYKPPWQMHRPNYLQPSRSASRRTVTFTEPEFGISDSKNKNLWRGEDTDPYSSAVSSLRRYSPSLMPAHWELSDHERYLREKQGREKDAFQEKIQRLKHLIQENKDQETGGKSLMQETISSRSLPRKEDQKIRWEETEKEGKDFSSHDSTDDSYLDYKGLQSRRSSTVKDSISDRHDSIGLLESDDEAHKCNELDKDDISDKEQLSGQFMEKDEDMMESISKANNNEKAKRKHLVHEKKDDGYADDFMYKHGKTEMNKGYSNHNSPHLEGPESGFLQGDHQSMLRSSNKEEYEPQPTQTMDQKSIQRDQKAEYKHHSDLSEKESTMDYRYQQDSPSQKNNDKDYLFQQDSLPPQDNLPAYHLQPDQQPQAEKRTDHLPQQDQESAKEQYLDYSFEQEQEHGQEQRKNYNFHQDQELPQEPAVDYDFKQSTHPDQPQMHSFAQDQDHHEIPDAEPPQKHDINHKFEGDPPTTQSDNFRYDQGLSQQWNHSEEDSQPIQKQSAPYDQDESTTEFRSHSSGDFTSKNQADEAYEQGNAFESYPSDGRPEHEVSSYEKFANGSGYESYGKESPNNVKSPEVYQSYTGNSEQYQDYQNYSQDQYNQQQNQAYAPQQGEENYQYEEDPNSAQYQYEGQDFNYQENPSDFTYPEEKNYQQDQQYSDQVTFKDQQYPADSQYQQDQNYPQDSNYPQEQHYQQNQDYSDQQQTGDGNYQPEKQYEDNTYQEPQQYENYNTNQPAPEDFSESTSESYQRSYQANDAFDNQPAVEQYRNILGADSSSEPAYSEASEIENQMAAVVGQGGSSITKMEEPTPHNLPPAAAASTPALAPLPGPVTSSSPSPASASSAARTKAAAKKRPPLTRKQSSISSENTDSRSQAATPTLTKMSESTSESMKASK